MKKSLGKKYAQAKECKITIGTMLKKSSPQNMHTHTRTFFGQQTTQKVNTNFMNDKPKPIQPKKDRI